MYKKFSQLLALAAIVMTLYSCKSTLSVIPQATNTIATATFADLNLERKDYIVMQTISAEATINAHFAQSTVRVEDSNSDFSCTWEIDKKTGVWSPKRIGGVVCLGYLSNDYKNELFDIGPYPHWIVRRLAIYRLINAAKVAGGDGVIEPIISTNVSQGRSRNDIVYKTTVSAKVIKIKPDGK